MNTPRILLASLLVSSFAALAAQDAAPPVKRWKKPEVVTAVRGLDPIELAAGSEVPGSAELVAVHGDYRYQFATEENRDLFLEEPERHAVMWDGACGRMGPLSGQGGPDRFAVFQERIFLFASDACRAGFLKAPEKFVDATETTLVTTSALRAQGQAGLEKALAGFGGAARVDGVATVRWRYALSTTSGGQEWRGARIVTLALPDRLRVDESWDREGYGHVLLPDGAFQYGSGEASWSGSTITEEIRHDALRRPLMLLRARGAPGFVAVAGDLAGLGAAAGKTPAAVAGAEYLTISHGGAICRLALEAGIGRIVEIAYRGRANGVLATIVKQFSDFRDAGGGLILPFVTRTFADGKELGDSNATITAIEVDATIEPDCFTPPER